MTKYFCIITILYFFKSFALQTFETVESSKKESKRLSKIYNSTIKMCKKEVKKTKKLSKKRNELKNICVKDAFGKKKAQSLEFKICQKVLDQDENYESCKSKLIKYYSCRIEKSKKHAQHFSSYQCLEYEKVAMQFNINKIFNGRVEINPQIGENLYPKTGDTGVMLQSLQTNYIEQKRQEASVKQN